MKPGLLLTALGTILVIGSQNDAMETPQNGHDEIVISLQTEYPMRAYNDLKELILLGKPRSVEEFIHHQPRETLVQLLRDRPEGHESLISYAHEKTITKSLGPLTKKKVMLGLVHLSSIGLAVTHAFINSNEGPLCNRQSPTAADIVNVLFDASVILQTLKSACQILQEMVYTRNNNMIMINNMLEQQARALAPTHDESAPPCYKIDAANIPEVTLISPGYPLYDYYQVRKAIEERNLSEVKRIIDTIKPHKAVLRRLLLNRPLSNESLLRTAQIRKEFETVSALCRRTCHFGFDSAVGALSILQLIYNTSEVANSSRGKQCSLETGRGWGILSLDLIVPSVLVVLTALECGRARNDADKLRDVNQSLKIEQYLHDTIRTYLSDDLNTQTTGEVVTHETEHSSSSTSRSDKKKAKKNSKRTVQQRNQ